jgi:hypothetical protein
MRRRRDPRHARVVLHACQDEAEARVWADACRSVLRSLEVADWWRVRIDPADAGTLLVSADYEPRPPAKAG